MQLELKINEARAVSTAAVRTKLFIYREVFLLLGSISEPKCILIMREIKKKI